MKWTRDEQNVAGCLRPSILPNTRARTLAGTLIKKWKNINSVLIWNICRYEYSHTPAEKAMHICVYAAFIHCLTTGPKPLPKPALHIVRSRASSFKWEYPLLSLRSSNSFLRLLPCLPVTSIPPFIFPSITRCRWQFLRKMWPIQLAFHLLISCRIFLCSLTLNNTSSFLKWSVQLIHSFPAPHFKTFQMLLIYCPKRPRYKKKRYRQLE